MKREVIRQWEEDLVTKDFLSRVQDYKEEYWKKLRVALEEGDNPKAQLYNGRVAQLEDIQHIVEDMKEEAE
jgi:DNA-binding ferritin-like protein